MNKDVNTSAIAVANRLLTRPPMKQGERPTVLACIGVIILFLAMGLLHLIHFSSLSGLGFIAKVNFKKA